MTTAFGRPAILRSFAVLSVLLFFAAFQSAALPISESPPKEGVTPISILLLGDSTVEGSVTREVEPEADQLEDVVRKLLDSEGDLPPIRVVNAGRGGEFVQGLVEKRYESLLEEIKKADFITIRYGLNDYGKREGFMDNFTSDLVALIDRLRKDNPKADIILETVCVYFEATKSEEVNSRIRKAAEQAGVPLLDIYARMAREIETGNSCLTYRRIALDKIPGKFHALLPKPWKEGEIVVMDNRLDAHLMDVPGWTADRHPNLAGYHIIGDEEAKFLAPRIRARQDGASK